MASILKVDEMQGVTSAGDITITSEGGSATQSLQQGLSKMWFHIVTSDVSIPDSFNVSSASDNGTGSFTQNNTYNMSNDDYAFAAMTGRKDNGAAESVMVHLEKLLQTQLEHILLTITVMEMTALPKRLDKYTETSHNG